MTPLKQQSTLIMNSMAANKMRRQTTSQPVKRKGKHAWIWVCFLAYLFALFYMLFFAEAFGRTATDHDYSYNLTLFQEIMRYYRYGMSNSWDLFLINVVGNVVVFVPFGMFLPGLFVKCKNGVLTALLCLEFSLAIEITQLISRVGTFDVDDLFLNTIGGMAGFVIFLLWTSIGKNRRIAENRK